MGEVYRATNMSLGRNVAVKILNKEHTANEDDVLRFLREARAAAAVRHPNVVDVFDVARDDDGTPFIVQELLAGEDLEQYLLGPARGRLSIEEAIEIMIPVADAVGAAHARNVVHRDLKPANIFLAKEGTRLTPKVLDFGACLYQTVGALSAKERRMLIGTPHYMAPEQISSAQDIDARVDVWAMGVILFELCVGETPFEAEDVNQVLKFVRTRPIPKLREVCPKAPAALEIAVGQCLERDRKKRLENALVLKGALERIRDELRGDTKRQRIDTPKEVVEPPSRRVPSLALSPRPPTRRGASRFTLSGPDDESVWDGDLGLGPKSTSRPIGAAPPNKASPAAPKPRTGRFEPQEASLELDDPVAPSSIPPVLQAKPKPSEASAAKPALPTPLPPPPPPSTPGLGEPRNLSFDSSPNPSASPLDLDLDLEPPPPTSTRPPPSSLPPVLDPRSATGNMRKSDIGLGDVSEIRSSKPDSAGGGAGASVALSPPPLGAPPSSMRGPPPVVATPGERPPAILWSTNARLTFAATIAVPALVAFAVLRFAPSVLAPLAHGMRGDSPLASGVLAVVTLVGAAALTMRAFSTERERSKGLFAASFGAIAFGIVMIIVTFAASETAELGIPPSLAVATPFLAPIVPIGIFVYAVARARAVWLSKYERREAVVYAVLASVMMLVALELGPAGAVRSVPSAPSPSATPAARP